MTLVIRDIRLFFLVYALSLSAYASMHISLYEQHQGNDYQQTAQGRIDFHGQSDASVFLTPIASGTIVQPPECEDGNKFSWNPWQNDMTDEAHQVPLPEIRLHRSGQPVIDLFFLVSMYSSGQVARTVRATNRGLFTLIDGHWVDEIKDWDFASPLLEYQLNGERHTSLSRFIRLLLIGIDVTALPNHNLFDDLFFSPHDSKICICVSNKDGKKRVVIRIRRSGNRNFMAIISLPAQSVPPTPRFNRRGSLDLFGSKFLGGVPDSRRHSQDNIPHPLLKSRKSSPSLSGSPAGSPKQTTNLPLNKALVPEEPAGFAVFEAFLIICHFQIQKYTQ